LNGYGDLVVNVTAQMKTEAFTCL